MKIFDTKADLQAASLLSNQLVQTKGFAVVGDGGGVVYNIFSPDSFLGSLDADNSFPIANENIASVVTGQTRFYGGSFEFWDSTTWVSLYTMS